MTYEPERLKEFHLGIKEHARHLVSRLGKKLVKMGKGSIKGGKRFKNSLLMRSQIKRKQKEAERQYLELGIRFYDDHRKEPPIEYLESIAVISRLEGEIAEIDEEIKKLHGIRLCPQCRSENPLNALYCCHCGHHLPELLEMEKDKDDDREKYCPKCGEKMTEKAVFCIKCGFKVDQTLPEISAAVHVFPVTAAAEEEEEVEEETSSGEDVEEISEEPEGESKEEPLESDPVTEEAEDKKKAPEEMAG